MAIEACYSKYKKNNFKIYIVICLALAAWCAYDGYFNETWIEKHTNPDGSPQPYLSFNRSAPPYVAVAAIFFAGCLFAVGGKKIVADEDKLILNNGTEIGYDSIEKIDKSNFESKDYFVVTYKDKSGGETEVKLSGRKFDNMAAILDKLVEKIT